MWVNQWLSSTLFFDVVFLDVVEDFVKLFQLGHNHGLAVRILSCVQVEIVLVVFLGWVKLAEWRDFGDDLAIENLLVELVFEILCNFLLCIVFKENSGTILGSLIVPLFVEGRRVVRFPVDFKQFCKRNNFGIKFDLDYFRVARGASANLFVGRVLHGPTGVSRDHGLDTLDSLEDGLGAPETSTPKGCFFQFLVSFFGFCFSRCLTRRTLAANNCCESQALKQDRGDEAEPALQGL